MKSSIERRIVTVLYADLVGFTIPFAVEVESTLRSFAHFSLLPSWLAGVEIVLDGWMQSGQLDAVRRALAEIAHWHDHGGTPELAKAAEALLRAKLLVAEGAAADEVVPKGRRALEGFRRCRAPWWIAKSIRILERTGAVSSGLIEEAGAIERSLRIPAAV